MYKYEDYQGWLNTVASQKEVFKLRDRVDELLKRSGVITRGSIMDLCTIGDSWQRLAMVDRLVEFGAIKEVKLAEPPPASQFIIYKKT